MVNNHVSPYSIRRVLVIVTLIIAGESIFILPFVLARIFRPTFLDAFELTNLELGLAFSVYGIVAMVSYFTGGPLADKFCTKRLLCTALVITAVSGVVFAGIPSLSTLTILYGFWGFTTIFLFWAALIKATREWGGRFNQGIAYGFLDGGRGLFAALLASLSVWIFAGMLPDNAHLASIQEKKTAMSFIIIAYSGFMVLVAILVWIVIPESLNNKDVPGRKIIEFQSVLKVAKTPALWFHSLIILCAYVGYKCTDDFSLFASDAFGYDDVEAAKVGTISYWVRPLVAIIAGILADKMSSSKVLIFGFLIMLSGSIIIAVGWVIPGIYWWLAITVAITSIGIYALRGVYFALFQEANIPINLTGTSVGIVSVIGFTPDIFMGPLMGYLIDENPGSLGHQYVFGVLAIFSVIGLLSSIGFRITSRNNKEEFSKA